MTTPDLTHYYAIHRQQRLDTARLVGALDTATADDRWRGGRLHPLAKWTTGFGHELHLHHTVEDAVIFPAIAAEVPTLAPAFATLDADHVVVASLLERLAPAVAAVGDPIVPFADAQATALDVAVELRDLLHRHLDVEDTELLPVIESQIDGEAWDAIVARGHKTLPKKGLAFSIPWNVAALPESERPQLVASAPLALRVIYRATRRSHDRLVAAAFDGIDVVAHAVR